MGDWESPVLNALSSALCVLDDGNRISFANQTAEQLFQSSAAALKGRALDRILPADSPIFELIGQARRELTSVTEYEITLETPKIGSHQVRAEAAPLVDRPGHVVLALHIQSLAERFDQQLNQRTAGRSLRAVTAMLAHELKNPLSGIKGAAQLLEPPPTDGERGEDRELAQLIVKETDRIVALIDSMEALGDERPLRRCAVNIHEVLDHVRRLSQASFGSHLTYCLDYDPSLPQVMGDKDKLIQAVLNLVKNAAEALSAEGGEITLKTAYRHGLRVAVAGRRSRIDLPLMVIVADNGPGIPAEIRDDLFDPFISTKSGSRGLGLALVAKVIGDLGGLVEVESRPRRTEFRLLLPVAEEGGRPETTALDDLPEEALP